MEANKERIKEIDLLFGNSNPPLYQDKRTLIGEGTLVKRCRKQPKKRQFFLFSDILVYCKYIWKGTRLTSQHILPLDDMEIEEVPNTDTLEHGFTIKSPKKSFVVYAATDEEREQWIRHIKNCILTCGGRKEDTVKSPVWIPDEDTQICMVCNVTNFNLVTRKHHCRKCGKIVCLKCSQKRFLIPEISNNTVRVCNNCYFILSQVP